MAEVIGRCNAAHHLPGRGATSTPTAPPLATGTPGCFQYHSITQAAAGPPAAPTLIATVPACRCGWNSADYLFNRRPPCECRLIAC